MESGVTDDLYGVWAGSATDAWAVGPVGKVLRWNGTGWAQVTAPNRDLLAGVVKAGGTLFAWGMDDVLSWDGAKWNREAVPLYPPYSGPMELFAFAGAPDGHAWALAPQYFSASGGRDIVHFNGLTWSQGSYPSAYTTGLWALSATDLWAVAPGDTGPTEIRRANGSSWTDLDTTGVTIGADSIWGTSASDVWVWDASYSSDLAHRSGSTWTTFDPGMSWPRAVHGPSATDVSIAGYRGQLSHWNGTAATLQLHPGHLLLGRDRPGRERGVGRLREDPGEVRRHELDDDPCRLPGERLAERGMGDRQRPGAGGRQHRRDVPLVRQRLGLAWQALVLRHQLPVGRARRVTCGPAPTTPSCTTTEARGASPSRPSARPSRALGPERDRGVGGRADRRAAPLRRQRLDAHGDQRDDRVDGPRPRHLGDQPVGL
ncbi:MAG: hypothetical protein QM765_49385 [Myxococcales bacterium]